MQEAWHDFSEYVGKVLDGTKPFWAFLFSTVWYLLFPDQALATAFGVVIGAAVLDIFTRWWAIIRSRDRFDSRKLWKGTSVKIVSYFVVSILAGLSYRLTPILQQPSIYLWTVVYAVMFLREVQSNVENLCDGGAKLGWLVDWTRRKQDQILNDQVPGQYGMTGYPLGWEQQAASAERGQRPPPSIQGEDPWREP